MPLIKAIHSLAQGCLPEKFRKRLGSLLGPVEIGFFRPVEGLVFDLKGGQFRADGCVFDIPKHLTTRGYRSCFLDGDYEDDERALIKKFLRPDDTVLECGACLGIVSCVTNSLLCDKSRHVVVEANPKVIPALYRNRTLNRAGFLIEHCAISSRSEETFYLHPKYIVGGTSQRPSDEVVRLPGRSVRELDARYGPFTVLIMDIEGSELDAFQAAGDLFSRYRLVIVELHPWAIGEAKVQQCRDILAAAGLRHVGTAGITEAWQRD